MIEENRHFILKNSAEKGVGVFSERLFEVGEVVMSGVIDEISPTNTTHASQIGENAFVIPIGLMALVNHACNPNCGIRVNETGAHDYVAMQNIEVGEEITFDYAMQNYSIDHFPTQCLCGTKDCRGQITGWKDLTEARKKEYEGFVSPYLIELDAKKS